MNLVTGAIGSLVPKLLQLLQDEYKLQKGMKKKIQFLSKELESIQGALRKVAAVPPDQLDEQVKIWARQAREASYNMEDVLDTFLVHGEGRPEPADQGKLKSTMKKMGKLFARVKARHDIDGAIEDINKQLQEVAERRARYKVDEIVEKPAATSTIDPRLEAMYKEVTQLVGINKAVGELISMLSLQRGEVSNEKVRIVSVVGVGGLGKTTLAKAVYDKLKPQFDCGAFVPVGRNPNLKKVLRDILIDLNKQKYTDSNMNVLDERQLIDEIRDFLGRKRYLIAIDDVWETQSWEIVKLAFVENNRGNRVISTSRKFEVTNGDVYNLKPLSYDSSKRLLYTRIFGVEGKCPDNQVDEISDKILNKCGGVPLAIITMASLLVGKSKEQWYEVCNSTGFHDKAIKQVDRTMWILSLSYYDLPCHLRTCLLYLSTFSEDQIISKYSLIWRWIAEDFVHKKPGIGLFEVAEGYFNDLINRSMIQAVMSQENNMGIRGYRVHDMVLDLLRSMSREENFVTVLDNAEGILSISSARRLAHQNRTIEYSHLQNYKGLPKIRSFIAYRCYADKGLSLPSFKLLRVLHLEGVYTGGCFLVEHIGNLLHLRYLGLIDTYITELPKEIGALKFLQTLYLHEPHIKELPLSVGLLTQLICLHTYGTNIPGGIIKKLTSLEELSVTIMGDHKEQFVNELGYLRELRNLSIMTIGMKGSMRSDVLQSIGNLPNVRSIRLSGDAFFQTDIDESTCQALVLQRHLRDLFLPDLRFSRLASCIGPSSLPNLTDLNLHVTDIDEQGLKILGALPELRFLELSTKSTVTVANIAADGLFQKLRSCKFCLSTLQFVLNEDSSVSFTVWNGMDDINFGSRKMDYCRAAPAVMPNLEELEFQVHVLSMMECKGSYSNLGLEYLTSLQKVTVDYSNNDDCSEAELMEAEAELRHAMDMHRNHPTLVWYTSEIFLAIDKDDDDMIRLPKAG
ncbi:hypothetical protein ACP70R_047878 [Stipagrostis hirtigluma subsp. patula]